MSIYEYDQEEHIRLEREDAYEDGRKEGVYQKLRELVEKKLEKGCSISEIAEILEQDQKVIEEIAKTINTK